MIDMKKSRRGRPRGSGIDDREALHRIAELLVERKAQNVAAAVRVFAGHDPSLIRRLQRKFRHQGHVFLASAIAKSQQLALQEGVRQEQLLRATQPLKWRHDHDATTQLMDALSLEREEQLKRFFART